MIPKYLLWSQKIEDHIARHKVRRDEVEQVFGNDPLIFKGRDQKLYLAYGRSDAGRFLTVAYVVKKKQIGIVLTARDMEQKERRLYRKKGRD